MESILNKTIDIITSQVKADIKILMLIRKLPQRMQAEELELLEKAMLQTVINLESLKE